MDLNRRVRRLEARSAPALEALATARALAAWLAGQGPPPRCASAIRIPPIYELPDPGTLTVLVRGADGVPRKVRGPRRWAPGGSEGGGK